jgi:hypothetical protein
MIIKINQNINIQEKRSFIPILGNFNSFDFWWAFDDRGEERLNLIK